MRLSLTMRVVCRVCGVVERHPAFSRATWPRHCGANMHAPGSREVRIGDAITAAARGLAALTAVEE